MMQVTYIISMWIWWNILCIREFYVGFTGSDGDWIKYCDATQGN